MITVVTGCDMERAREVLDRLNRRGCVILDRLKGEDIRLINSFSVRNLGPGDVPRGAAVFRDNGKLVARNSDGARLATLKPVRTILDDSAPQKRRKLRRIGGSDRLWRALRGGR